MNRHPKFKLYEPDGRYVAAVHQLFDAVMFVSVLEHGATIRHGHSKKRTLFTEGVDADAHESYDAAFDIANGRLMAERAALQARLEESNRRYREAEEARRARARIEEATRRARLDGPDIEDRVPANPANR